MELQDLIKQYHSIKVDSVWQESNKNRLISEMATIFPVKEPGYHFKPAIVTLSILAVIFVSGLSTTLAAKNSLPGDVLYPVKKMVEKVRLAVVFSQSDKNVLKAELLNQRLVEMEILVKRVETDSRAESNLITATKDLHQDLIALKKDIIAQSSPEVAEAIPDVTIDKGSLPIKDGKRIVQVIQSEDLKQILEETQKLLKEKNLVTALEMAESLEKKLVEPVATSTPSTPAQIEEETVNENLEESIKIQPIIQPKQILKQSPGSIGSSVEKQDFGIAPIREEGFNGGLIREK